MMVGVIGRGFARRIGGVAIVDGWSRAYIEVLLLRGMAGACVRDDEL